MAMPTHVLENNLYPVSSPDLFFAAIEEAKNQGKQEDKDGGTFGTKNSKWFGAFVHSYSVKEYAETTPYLFDDGRAGFALKDRDIVSVFKHPKCTLKPALDITIPAAIALGGNRLDCFNGGLPAMYAKFGFLPVAKLRFNAEYAPQDWNYERDNHPDIVYMVYKKGIVDRILGEGIADRIERIKTEISRLNYSVSYEEALRIQNDGYKL